MAIVIRLFSPVEMRSSCVLVRPKQVDLKKTLSRGAFLPYKVTNI